jgi:endonuclease/exonuclease/phosphatase family metal-dependent hydrolase
MRAIALLIPLLCACGPAEPRTGGVSADRPGLLRVVSWNVHDLFDERPGPGGTAAVPAALVEARLEAVAAVLRRLDADLVLLQEVEDLPLLRRLAVRTGHGEAWLLPGNDPRGIEVALLSRHAVTGYRGQAGEQSADGRLLWPRDAVVARVALGTARVTLIGTHLSSHLSDPAGERRLLQAARLRELADEEAAADPGALLLVGGDLNDAAGAAALQPLFGDGRWLDGAGVDPGGSDPANSPAWTWSDGKRHEPLDHLALRAAQRRALVAGWVAGGPDVAAASDHRPVVLDLQGW